MKVIKFAPGLIPVFKHQEHDQKTHGTWATGVAQTRELLLSQASKFKTFEEFSFAISQGGLRPTVWHIAGDDFELNPNFKPQNRLGGTSEDAGIFVGDPETWQDYATDRSIVIQYEITELSFTSKPLSDNSADLFPDQSGNQGFFIRPSGFPKLKEVARISVSEAIKRAKEQQDLMPKSKAEAKQIWDESRSVSKHQEHDQSSHGNWAKGGSGLGIEEAMALQKSSDPLKQKIYDAEELIRNPSKSKLEKPIAPEWGVFVGTRDEFDRAVKEYDKKWMAWAVEEQADILSDTGERLLDGTPSGVKKYVEEIIKSDWFIETFGDGKSLPPLDVKTSPTSVAGVHQLGVSKDRYSGRIVKRTHSITINRQFTKDEVTILHEISHYATTISQTESFSSHGVEFARNHVFISEKVAGSARAKALASAYAEKGVQDGD